MLIVNITANLSTDVIEITIIESMMEINKKNQKIHDKIQDLSQVRKKKPNSVSFDKLRNSMLVNRSVSKIETSKNMEVEN